MEKANPEAVKMAEACHSGLIRMSTLALSIWVVPL